MSEQRLEQIERSILKTISQAGPHGLSFLGIYATVETVTCDELLAILAKLVDARVLQRGIYTHCGGRCPHKRYTAA